LVVAAAFAAAMALAVAVFICCHSVAERRNLQLQLSLPFVVVVVLLLSFRSEAEESAVATVLPWHLPCHCLFFNQSRPPQKLRHPDRSCRCFCFCPAVKKGFQRALKKSLF